MAVYGKVCALFNETALYIIIMVCIIKPRYKRKALDGNWLCVGCCPAATVRRAPNITGHTCTIMKENNAVSIWDTVSFFMEQCCFVWTDL